MVLCVWSDKRTQARWMAHLSALHNLRHLHFAQANPKHPNDTALLQGLSYLTQLTSLSLGLMDGGVYLQVSLCGVDVPLGLGRATACVL